MTSRRRAENCRTTKRVFVFVGVSVRCRPGNRTLGAAELLPVAGTPIESMCGFLRIPAMCGCVCVLFWLAKGKPRGKPPKMGHHPIFGFLKVGDSLVSLRYDREVYLPNKRGLVHNSVLEDYSPFGKGGVLSIPVFFHWFPGKFSTSIQHGLGPEERPYIYINPTSIPQRLLVWPNSASKTLMDFAWMLGL